MCLKSLRLNLARFLVVVSFVWPFINTNYFLPESQVEINFLPVFLAIGLAPELLFEDLISLFLIVAAVAAAAIWGTVDSALRLIIGAVPCLFLVCLYRYFLRCGKELIPRPVAYWASSFRAIWTLRMTNLGHAEFRVGRLSPRVQP